jgi:hypothetical protein
VLQKTRTWWAERKQRERELDRQYAAEERALIDDPEELDIELDQARAGRLWLAARRLGPGRERRP